MTATLEAPIAPEAVEIASGSEAPERRTIRKVARNVLVAFVVFMVVGNLLILGLHLALGAARPAPPVELTGVHKFDMVDARLWRGAAPSVEGYRSLAEAGARTIIDLRAEDNVHVDAEWLDDMGVRLVRMPIRDGQIPSDGQLERFIDAVASSPGPVYVHCGAGVGRTGTMAAAWLMASGQGGEWSALRRNLEIGPPSLEQIAFVAGLEDGYRRPLPVLTAVSRVLDAPRRLWSRYGL